MRRLLGSLTFVLLFLAAASGSGAAAFAQPVSHADTATAPPPVTVAAVGDMLAGRAPTRLIARRGGKAPFVKVASRLRAADVAVGNVETPISRRGRALAGKAFTFKASPAAVDGLTYAGFDLLGLANNHVKDFGPTAFGDTLGYLKKARLAYAGAGKSKKAAWKPAIIERNGAKIAYLAFSEITPTSFAATSSRSGTAYVYGDFGAVSAAIKSARKQADYVIVSFHWGKELRAKPTARQVREGRAAIRAGADLVLSHHPHVLQGVEFYKDGLIAYSLGNFVFSPGSAAGRDSMILSMTLGPQGVSRVRARPVWIDYNGRPVPTSAGSRANARIMKLIKTRSKARGTHVTVSGTEALLKP